jgi:hypothetical protein
MKQKAILVALCVFFVMGTNVLSEENKIVIKVPFAFQDRFQEGSQQLGFPEGNVLQVGCLIKPAGSPIKEVTIKNLDTGLALTASPQNIGGVWSGLYLVYPMPPFDPSKHMGVWEILVKDEKGNEATAKTHRLSMKGEMPYVEGLKASGNPLSPTLTWTAPSDKDIPPSCAIRYQVRLLKNFETQFHKSKATPDTKYQIPEGVIKSEDLSKIYVRIDAQGYDKTDSEHPLPLELKSQTFMSLEEALGKQ